MAIDLAAPAGSQERAASRERDDLTRFTDELRRMVVDGALRTRLGAASRARCQARFAEPTMVARHLQLWMSAAGANLEAASAVAG